ncbi:M56 family metallopeptidase [Chitinophagales bacterium]|nr:M56 family metallopeptidase [Chitinophagales bacterium]
MISYFLLVQLLLCIGAALYLLLVRNRLSSQLQKRVLTGMLVSVLLLPLFFLTSAASPTTIVAPTETEELCVSTYEESLLTDFCPTGEVLEVCYQIAISTTDFCECANVERANLVVYESNWLYNLLAWQELAVVPILSIGAGLLLFILALNILFLVYLVFTSRHEKTFVHAKSVTLLYRKGEQAVASFMLGQRYVLWSDQMDLLSTNEREAILLHEMAHIQERDTYLKVFLHLCQLIWIINPVFYFIKKEFIRLSEFVADEYALEFYPDRKAYAQLLLRIQSAPEPALSSAFKGSLLKERILHILDPKKATGQQWAFMGCLLMMLSFALSSYTALPILDREIKKLEIYQTLQQIHDQEGKNIFCKNCDLQ